MAKKKTNITVILPIHELVGESDITLFKNSIESVGKQTTKPDELLIVVPKGSEVEKFLSDFDFGTVKSLVRIVSNEGKTDFASQINYGEIGRAHV